MRPFPYKKKEKEKKRKRKEKEKESLNKIVGKGKEKELELRSEKKISSWLSQNKKRIVHWVSDVSGCYCYFGCWVM